MSPRRVWVVLLVVAVVQVGAWSSGLRSVGVRAILPIGQMPFLLGFEATGDVPMGVLTGSFFLSGDGRTLITVSYDLRLAGGEATSQTYVRATAGLAYFDRTQFLPSLVVGGGLALEVPISSLFSVAASGEFLYPVAFPVPLVSGSGRWTPW